jgi:single-stranded-DNA-specific exonuclease
MQKSWKLKTVDPAATKWIQNFLGCHPATASLLAQKNLTSETEIKNFLQPSLHHLRPPFALTDMQKAVARITQALEKQENLLIFGDYDVDGVTATTLISQFLDEIGAKVQYYIPDRMAEGYGLKVDHIIELAIPDQIDLIITVDCGIASHEAVSVAQTHHIDIIITDHHDPPTTLPAALAVVNPKRLDCSSELSHLSGVGIVFYLAMALRMYLRDLGFFSHVSEPNLKKYCDLVALGTVADMVPLVQENRILTVCGLEVLRTTPRPGLKALAQISGIEYRHVDTEDVAFRLGPRINAAGRMDHASQATKLLYAKTEGKAEHHANKLNIFNKLRQITERDVLNDILTKIEKQGDLRSSPCLVFASSDWHPGVVGIVAARLTRQFNKPTILISIEKDIGVGSARSIPGIDIRAMLEACNQHLLGFGGHPMAAGLQIAVKEIESFRTRLEGAIQAVGSGKDLSPELPIDCILELPDITDKILDEIATLGPFGNQNPEPVFLAHNISIRKAAIVGTRHCRMQISPRNVHRPVLSAIQFNVNPTDMLPNHFTKIAYHLQWNRWNGNKSIQLVIKDHK